MRKMIMQRLVALTAVSVLVGLLAPSGASAVTRSQAPLRLRTGTTTLTTAPNLATTLLGAGIVPFATEPGQSSLTFPRSGPALKLSFPVSGGDISLRPLRGVIRHNGGLLLVNVGNGKSAQVDAFVVDLRARTLTARVVGTTTRVPVFSLDLSRASIAVRGNLITLSRVGLRLTGVAATALNTGLSTTAFAAGQLFGTAGSQLRR
ncbi:MAG: hypothetical protein WCD35_18520 [Mycobacteriales bacterium]